MYGSVICSSHFIDVKNDYVANYFYNSEFKKSASFKPFHVSLYSPSNRIAVNILLFILVSSIKYAYLNI